jgi:Tfp pilus assembly protein PilX
VTRLLAILRREDGVAVAVAMGALSVLMVLGAVALSAAVSTETATRSETLRKRAFQTADAGVQATQYRMNMLGPAADKCIGGPTSTVASPPAGSTTCAGYTESAGNGATYTSYTSTPLAAGARCAGTTISSTTSTVDQRCVTAVGSVDGVQRRVQARVASYAAAPLFPVAGIVSATSVDMSGSAQVAGTLGLNGILSLQGAPSVTRVVLAGSAASISRPTWMTPPPSGPVTDRYVLPSVDPGSSATTADGNARLSNGTDALPQHTSTWNAATRSLSFNSGTVFLGGGVYNFCNLTVSGAGDLKIVNPARTAIFIDSPTRPGSNCPPGSGNLAISGSGKITQNTTDPTAVQLYIVGNGSVVDFPGATAFYGTIYAPSSTLTFTGSGAITGAAAANKVIMSGAGTFYGDQRATTITTNGVGVYFRTAWRECDPAGATTTDPGAGC